MKTSARNQFAGTVSAIRHGAINDEVTLDIAGGLHLVATVTRESCEELGLNVGAPAFGLVKASSVILIADAGGVRLSARNQFAGTVSHVMPGAVNTEVVLDLPGGGQRRGRHHERKRPGPGARPGRPGHRGVQGIECDRRRRRLMLGMAPL